MYACNDDIIYIRLDSRGGGIGYPNTSTFANWMRDGSRDYFRNRDWVMENKLCVVYSWPDHNLVTFYITATRKWVDNNCPELLTHFSQFLRYIGDDGRVHGDWGIRFSEYLESNIGIIKYVPIYTAEGVVRFNPNLIY